MWNVVKWGIMHPVPEEIITMMGSLKPEWPEDFKVESDGETLSWEFIGEIPEGTCLEIGSHR
jgi:hypothetical protein